MPRLGWMALLALGCGEPPAAQGPTLPDAWPQAVTHEPARFAQLLEQTPREGWIALHAHDSAAAWTAFTGPTPATRRARARAAWELARVHESLARLHAAVEVAYHTEQSERSGPDEVGRAFAALASDCSVADGAAPLEARAAAHARALSDGDPKPLLDLARQPVRIDLDPVPHTWFDPCVHHTLFRVWDRRALEDLDATQWSEASAWVDGGLESNLFAPWLDRTDLRRALDNGRSPGAFAAQSPATRALGLPDRVPGDTEAARAEVRALDEALDAWRSRMATEAPEEGRALEAELGLLQRFRQEWLLSRATLAVEDGQPREALAFLDLARDVTQRDVGPANSPRLFALLAEARFAAGREREALDALHPLSDDYPEILGLRERLGDLTVLRGLTRTGDSKEN